MGRNSSGWSRHCYPGEQTDIVETILDFIPTIDFTGTDAPKPSPVSLFETNIRYLGGLLSAYDLLQGPFRHLKIGKKKVDALLTQATTLADTLKYAFDMPSGIPINNIFIENKTFIDDRLTEGKSQINVPAAMGNLVLEWQRLSDLTSHTQYGIRTNKAEKYWLSPSSEVFPGPTGGTFNVETGEILDGYRVGHQVTTQLMSISSNCSSTAQVDLATMANASLKQPTQLSNTSSRTHPHVQT